MIRKLILGTCFLAGCATATPGEEPGVAGAYRLLSIDNLNVGRIGMRLTLETNGTARLAYDCGERFANYRISSGVITFSEISPSTGSCPSDSPSAAEKRLSELRGRLLYGSHRLSRSRNRLTLSGSHTYVFAAES